MKYEMRRAGPLTVSFKTKLLPGTILGQIQSRVKHWVTFFRFCHFDREIQIGRIKKIKHLDFFQVVPVDLIDSRAGRLKIPRLVHSGRLGLAGPKEPASPINLIGTFIPIVREDGRQPHEIFGKAGFLQKRVRAHLVSAVQVANGRGPI